MGRPEGEMAMKRECFCVDRMDEGRCGLRGSPAYIGVVLGAQGLGSESSSALPHGPNCVCGRRCEPKRPVRRGRDLAVDPKNGSRDGSDAWEAPKGEVWEQSRSQRRRRRSRVMQRARLKVEICVSWIR